MNDHKRWVGNIFDRAASAYGMKGCEFFNYFGKRLVEFGNVRPDMHVLDIATGRGAVLFPIAEGVGPLGKVVGIDISQQMILETSKDAIKRNMPWIELHCMDAEKLDFPDNSFDRVFCGFALFFLPSLLSALLEFKRVLKSGGLLVVSTWGDDSELDLWINLEINKLSKTNSLIATPLWTDQELRNALEQANFSDIQIIEETKLHSFSSPEEWWNSLWTHGTRSKLEQLSPDHLTSLHARVLQKGEQLIDSGQSITEAQQVFYGVSRKSDKKTPT